MATEDAEGGRAPPPADALSLGLGGAAVALAVLLASPWQISDLETYMRLAFGRLMAEAGPCIGDDPFLYSLPGLRWRNPQWLGDLLLFGVHRAAGEPGLVALKLVVYTAGWLLVYLLGLRSGGAPLVVASLIVLALAGSEWRLTERNDMHAFWLVPLYGLCLLRARARRRFLCLLLPLGVLWANLHGSFALGWLLVGARLLGARFGPERDRVHVRALAAVLVLHPLLPLLSSDGLRAYGQLADHLRHGAMLKHMIAEWEPVARLPATLPLLPLHILSVIGPASFLFRACRKRLEGLLLVTAGLLLAHGSNRFVLLFGLLAVAPVAQNLAAARAGLAGSAARALKASSWALAVAAVALLVPAVAAAHTQKAARARWEQPSRPARWLNAYAPPGSRLLAPYDGAQWLMWEAPRIPLYIAPHFTFPTPFLARFFAHVWPRPERFAAEVQRFGVGLAMVDLQGRSLALLAHLGGAPEWRLVYLDGFFALYARHEPRNTALISSHGYRCLRAGFAFTYLAACPEDGRRSDLERLEREGPLLFHAIRGFELLQAGAAEPDATAFRARAASARDLLSDAVAALPTSPPLSAYLIEAHLRLGERAQARRVLEDAMAKLPGSSRLEAIARALAEPAPAAVAPAPPP